MLVKEPRVLVYSPPGHFASFIHFDVDEERLNFVEWLRQEGIQFRIVQKPPLS